MKVEEFESLDLTLLDEGPAGIAAKGLIEPKWWRKGLGWATGATPIAKAGKYVVRGTQVAGTGAGIGAAATTLGTDSFEKDSDEAVGDLAAVGTIGAGTYYFNKFQNWLAKNAKKAEQYTKGERSLWDNFKQWVKNEPQRDYDNKGTKAADKLKKAPKGTKIPTGAGGQVKVGGKVSFLPGAQTTDPEFNKFLRELEKEKLTKREFTKRVTGYMSNNVASAFSKPAVARGAGLKGLLARLFRKGGAHIALGAATGGIANALMWGSDLYAAVDYTSDVVSGKVAANDNAIVHRGMAFEQIAKVFANGKSLEEQKKLVDRILSPEIMDINQKTNPLALADTPVHGARPTSMLTPDSGTQTPMGFFRGKVLDNIFNTKTENPWDTVHDADRLMKVRYDETGQVQFGPNTKEDFDYEINELQDRHEKLSTYDRIARGKDRPAGYYEEVEQVINKLTSARNAIKSAPEVRRDAIATWAHNTLEKMHSVKQLESVSTLMAGIRQAEHVQKNTI